MLQITDCIKEVHAAGGPGLFVLGFAQHNLEALCAQYSSQVQTIYLDPPFGTGDTFQVRLGRGKSIKLTAYADTLDEDAYLSMMRTVLSCCHTLLSPTGSLFLHIDYRMSAKLRLLLDELFGPTNFLNEIIWMYRSGGRSRKHFSRKHDTILFYRKSNKHYFHIEAVGMPRGPERRNHMKRSIDEHGRVCFSIRSAGKIYTYYEDTPIFPSDVWTDIEHLHQHDPERVGYATQKPESLLKRIILASTQPGDLVADFFSGGGTTAAVAAQLDRRFLACDCSPIAMHVLRKRLLDQANAISMLDAQHPFTMEYPQSALHRWQIDLTGLQDGYLLRDVSCADAENLPIAYCALGNLLDGCFKPAVHAFYPVLPLELRTAQRPCNAIQIALADGKQGFFQL